MTAGSKPPSDWMWLTPPIALLIFVAAGSGLLIQDLYSASSDFIAGLAIGMDLITLFIALPVLVYSAVLTRRGSQQARLIWLGMLFYIVYSYALTAFMVNFNYLYLVYIAVLGFSTHALIGGLISTDMRAVKSDFAPGTPVKYLSIFFGTVVIAFSVFWLADIIPAHIRNDLPRMIKWAATPSHGYYVLDLALLFPALGLTAFWLWQERPIGYTLAGSLLTFLGIEILAIISGMLYVAYRGYPFPVFPEILVYIAGALFTNGILIWFLKKMGTSK